MTDLDDKPTDAERTRFVARVLAVVERGARLAVRPEEIVDSLEKLFEAHDARLRAEQARRIPLSERYPDPDVTVVVWDSEGSPWLARYEGGLQGGWELEEAEHGGWQDAELVAWSPLPCAEQSEELNDALARIGSALEVQGTLDEILRQVGNVKRRDAEQTDRLAELERERDEARASLEKARAYFDEQLATVLRDRDDAFQRLTHCDAHRAATKAERDEARAALASAAAELESTGRRSND